jgi:hypothetical protein
MGICFEDPIPLNRTSPGTFESKVLEVLSAEVSALARRETTLRNVRHHFESILRLFPTPKSHRWLQIGSGSFEPLRIESVKRQKLP